MATPQRPNILVVMTDQQRADSISLDPDGWTPHLAAFSREAISFTQTYCPSPHCCPSRATFFTGLYPSRHGVWNNLLNQHALTPGLRPGVRLWSTDLADAGYDLYFSGKWHVDTATTPRDHGWHEAFSSAVHGREHHGPHWDFYKKLVETPAGTGPHSPGLIRRPGYGNLHLYRTLPPGQLPRHDEEALEHALRSLDAAASHDRPWLLYTGFFGPHDPYEVPSEWLDKVPPGTDALPPQLR